ncbi:MAG: hypothetical protein KDC42_04485 [Ignavibacteriae bacterium]|nr:hypothetical protein [Ignavibacteriota bacterium]
MRITMFSKKTLLSLLVLAFSISLISTVDAYSQKKPNLSVWTNKKSYNPGESGVLYIKFKTGSGVKIPKTPNITVNISGGVEGAGMQDYSGNGSGEYLGNNTVKYNFTVPSNASGKVTISGSVKFGYCSSVDGVCKIGKSTFSRNISIK